MISMTARSIVAALLAAGLVVLMQTTATAADVDTLIKAVAQPDTPAEKPADIADRAWKTRPDEAWANYRAEAAKELTQTGASAVQPLLDLIATTDRNAVKIAALTALSMMTSTEGLRPAGPPLIRLLSDENSGVRYLAVKTLGVMRYGDSVPHLHRLVRDKEPALRMVTADALGEIARPDSADALMSMTDDEDKDVRLHATDALGKLGVALAPTPDADDPLDVIGKLAGTLRSDDVNERNAAVQAIKDLLGYDIAADGRWIIAHLSKDREPIIEDFEAWWQKTREGGKYAVTNAPELTLRINIAANVGGGQPVAIRVKSIGRIRMMRDKRAVDYLILMMRDPNTDVRKAAVQAASQIAGRNVEYNPAYSEVEWLDRVDRFKLQWEEAQRK